MATFPKFPVMVTVPLAYDDAILQNHWGYFEAWTQTVEHMTYSLVVFAVRSSHHLVFVVRNNATNTTSLNLVKSAFSPLTAK